VSNAPADVTPYGAVAYRVDGIAQELDTWSDILNSRAIHDFANKLRGVVDDLVALNLRTQPVLDAAEAVAHRHRVWVQCGCYICTATRNWKEPT
jgi:hypothetical protein